LPVKVTRAFGMSKLVAKKYSPELLLGLGIVGGVAAAVMAARAHKRAEEALKDERYDVSMVNETAQYVNREDEAEVVDYRKALVQVYTRYGLGLAKVYGPSVALGIASIVSLVGSHGIMSRRSASLMAAYALIQEGFSSYRERVVEELGIEKDHDFLHGLKEEVVTVEEINPETGRKNKVKKTVKTRVEGHRSVYARLFDEANSMQFKRDPKLNLFFLTSQQNYANDLLRARGYLFLNEVYNMLGMDWTPAGQMVGWVWGRDEEKDAFVDFGLGHTDNQAFVLGLEDVAYLDFNVDGPIYELI